MTFGQGESYTVEGSRASGEVQWRWRFKNSNWEASIAKRYGALLESLFFLVMGGSGGRRCLYH